MKNLYLVVFVDSGYMIKSDIRTIPNKIINGKKQKALYQFIVDLSLAAKTLCSLSADTKETTTLMSHLATN